MRANFGMPYFVMIIALVSALLLPLGARGDAKPLTEAFRSELEILKAQRDRLNSRRDALAFEAERRASVEMKRVEEIQAQVESLGRQTRELMERNEKMPLESELDNFEPIYDATLAQMNALFEKFSSPKEERSDPVSIVEKQSRIAELLGRSVATLEESFGIRSRKGEFFLVDGKKTRGTIWEIGNIAAYGDSPVAQGALVPAGDGMLKLWDKPIGKSLELVMNREGKDAVKSDFVTMFLYESKEKAVHVRKEKTLRETLSGGGPIAYVLVLLGLVTLFLVIMKGSIILRATRNSESLIRDATELLRKGRADDAVTLCRTNRGAFARVMETTISGLGKSRKALEDTISEVIIHEGSLVDRFGSIIVVIAAAAPLLGLLGTVSGMIHTFEIITEFGENDPKLLSAGISEALIDTMLGLVVAIPALLFGNILSDWVERVKDGLEKASLSLMTAHEEHRLQESRDV